MPRSFWRQSRRLCAGFCSHCCSWTLSAFPAQTCNVMLQQQTLHWLQLLPSSSAAQPDGAKKPCCVRLLSERPSLDPSWRLILWRRADMRPHREGPHLKQDEPPLAMLLALARLLVPVALSLLLKQGIYGLPACMTKQLGAHFCFQADLEAARSQLQVCYAKNVTCGSSRLHLWREQGETKPSNVDASRMCSCQVLQACLYAASASGRL